MSAITDPHDVKKTAPAVAAEPMNRDDAQKVGAVQKVSFDLLHQFLATIASKKYTEALDVCAKILKDDPNNPLILEYEPLIREKLELDAKHGEADSDGDVGDNGSGTENDSEANSSSDEDDEIGDGSELSDSSGESINNNED
ncbi:hypothetical protein BJ742DRAFT_793431 [Cladochytrium replicatum]|nr:hypothetical protein BJ742DRAFT_793431 [Cladochytrium replicatum]